MTSIALYQILVFLLALILLIRPLGWYMARVYQGKSVGLNSLLEPIEMGIYRFCRIDAKLEMDWKAYALAILCFNCMGILVAYLIQRMQYYLPLNPQHVVALTPALAFNTAVSFATNTDWQAYSGETSLSYFSQMFVCGVQNFLSAATGMCVLIALIRGIVKHESTGLGNYWVDMVRTVLYILMPLSIVLAVTLVSQGAIQNLHAYQRTTPLSASNKPLDSTPLPVQYVPMGPVASLVAIKQLGSNGGGFFNTNSAHPFENPTPITHFIEMLALMLIPASLCYTYGLMIKNVKQAYVILFAMFAIYLPALGCSVVIEQIGNPKITQMGIDLTPQLNSSPGGNMEGKETRNGVVNSAIWAVSTTATSNGAVSSMLESYIPLAGMMSLWMMALQEDIFGGVGSGLYGMLMMVVIAVFVAGLMVGRTPEYLGKKIEPYEMKMASVSILIVPILILLFTAIACVTPLGQDSVPHPGPHAFTQMLYTFTSMSNNNGSSFAGFKVDTPFYLIAGGLVMLIARYWVMISVLALAGALVKKKRIPNTSGTLATNTTLFLIFLIAVIVVMSALSFLPALALGPLVEQFRLWGIYG